MFTYYLIKCNRISVAPEQNNSHYDDDDDDDDDVDDLKHFTEGREVKVQYNYSNFTFWNEILFFFQQCVKLAACIFMDFSEYKLK